MTPVRTEQHLRPHARTCRDGQPADTERLDAKITAGPRRPERLAVKSTACFPRPAQTGVGVGVFAAAVWPLVSAARRGGGGSGLRLFATEDRTSLFSRARRAWGVGRGAWGGDPRGMAGRENSGKSDGCEGWRRE